jgi:hypothetical protein
MCPYVNFALLTSFTPDAIYMRRSLQISALRIAFLYGQANARRYVQDIIPAIKV